MANVMYVPLPITEMELLPSPGDRSTDSYQTDNSDEDDASDCDFESCERFSYTPYAVNDIIHKMWDTVLDHNNGYQQKLASSTYLVYKIEGMHKPGILKNDTAHAEKQLISIIQGNFTAPLKIIIYINNSPCAECATSLKQFMVDNQNIKMVLYIAHLYNIKRSSCVLRAALKKESRHVDCIPKAFHEKNYLGLRNLMSIGGHRCRIEAFKKKVWEDLLALTGISTQMMDNYNRRKKGYDRSRQNEDKRIKKDLNEIKRKPKPPYMY